ncbi:MAG: bifunctional alpha/beta hydrolase/OsmC family protein [Myxococcota bacterium]
MKTIRTRFDNGRGHELSARLELPLHDHPSAFAVFAHCFTCSKNLKVVQHISEALTAEGIAVLRFDFTGLGQSQGDFAKTSFSTNISDLVATCRFLEAEYEAPSILIGHSLGGAAVLHAAHALPSVKAVATIGAPFDPAHVRHLLTSTGEIPEDQQTIEFEIAGRTFTLDRAFLEDLDKHDPEELVSTLKRPLLIMHAPLDHTVGIENASRIFSAAKHPKSFISLDKADHVLSNEADARYAGDVIASWVHRFLPQVHEHYEGLERGEAQTVVRIGRERFHTDILSSDHALLADEPKGYGGGDEGPSPYDLLLSALGACTAMTLRMYADRKGWSLDAVTVRLTHEQNHKTDAEGTGAQGHATKSKGKGIELIRKFIELTGDLDADQRERLHQIADRCPVHRTLLNPTLEISSALAQED